MNAAATVRRAAITGLVIAVATVVLTPAAAFASPAGQNNTVVFSQSTDLPSTTSTSSGTVHGSVSLSTHLSLTQSDTVAVGWDDSTVRQGGAVNPVVTRQPGVGTLAVHQTVGFTGGVDVGGSTVDITFAPTAMDASTPCTFGAEGSTTTCTTESGDVTVVPAPCPDVPLVIGFDAASCPLAPKVSVRLRTTSTFGVAAVTAARALNGENGTVDLGTGQPVTDTVSLPCTTSVGSPVGYTLSGSLQGEVHTVTELVWSVQVSAPVPVPVPVPPPVFTVPGFPYVDVYDTADTVATTDSALAMTAPDVSYALGTAMANNVPPTVSAAPTFAGDEGGAIAFTATVTGPCAAGATFVWNFSDGGVAYGNPSTHVFAESGPFSGQVVATDVTGLSGTANFGVSVANLPPAVIVTPSDPTTAWGRPLTLQAQATDPGAAEQATLTYAWDFHDGSAIVAGGPSETRVWAGPGTPHVTVTVCDKHAACTSKDVTVTVRPRTTSTSYTGDLTATYSAPVRYRGAVVDEFGGPVVGAGVTFATGPTSLASATTGASGSAVATVAETLTSGSYPITATFAGSDRYVASASGPVTQTVTSMATAVVYTGTLSSKPNAKIPLSATVTDVLGHPIANQTVTFVVGSQTITAQTGANGVAATTLKLTLKPGTYPVRVSWSGIAGRYAAAIWTGSFKLNTK